MRRRKDATLEELRAHLEAEAGNTQPDPAEKYSLLAHSLKFGSADTRELAQFFIENIDNIEPLKALKSLMPKRDLLKRGTSEMPK